ncbi:PilZ domain-containing protein [Candidatus Omnitrophota bacterium]
MREKRRFIRFNISLKIAYTVQKDPKVERTGMTKDVSAGGMQILTEENLQTGSRLEIKVFIPEAANPAHLSAVVLWSKKKDPEDKKLSHSAGIEFKGIEEDNKSTFLKFLCDLMYRKIEEKEGG